MATLQAKNNPQSRIDVGDHVIESSKTANVHAIKTKLVAFTKIHTAYRAAHNAALAAEAKLDAAQSAVGEADGVQDSCVMALAAKMIGDGAPKGNPLSLFKLPPPSKLVVTKVEEEVKLTKRLAKQASAWKSASAPTKAAASKLGKAASVVETALAKLPLLGKAHAAAIAKRDALGVPWTRAFAQLKNATRVAEDDGASGLFATLFGAPAARPAMRSPHANVPPSPPAAPAPAAQPS